MEKWYTIYYTYPNGKEGRIDINQNSVAPFVCTLVKTGHVVKSIVEIVR